MWFSSSERAITSSKVTVKEPEREPGKVRWRKRWRKRKRDGGMN